MKTKNNLTKNTSNGFTLIELLVVIAIIGILGAIVYAPFQSARRKGRDASRVIEMKNLVSTITLYADSHKGYYPCSMTELKNSMTDPLPSNVNLTGAEDLSKYNYAAYYDPSKAACSGVAGAEVSSSSSMGAVGFHLWTHLETANNAIVGAADCQGAKGAGSVVDGNGLGNPPVCIDLGQSITVAPAVAGVPDSSLKDAFSTTSRSSVVAGEGDYDNVCATDSVYCILDYHQ